MLTRVRAHGRIAACGAISGTPFPPHLPPPKLTHSIHLTVYNSLDSTHLANYSQIITNRLVLQGFIVIDYLPRYSEGIAALSAALKAGKLDVKDAETLVKAEFEKVPETWGLLFKGGNTGKLITQVAELA